MVRVGSHIPDIEYLKVLLIEDDLDDVLLVEEALEDSLSLEVDMNCVGSLREGLELLSQNDYDVIISDLGLPDTSGLEAIQTLVEADSSTPILCLTGNSGPGWPERLMSSGADEYLDKGHMAGSLGRAMINTVIRAKLVSQLHDALLERDAALEVAANKIEELSDRVAEIEMNLCDLKDCLACERIDCDRRR
mgnify:CR=1 FL=1|jgi:DNA-binding NarL/FixJ family response regulator